MVSTCVVPGSKSYTNRALLLAAMTQGRVSILQPLISDDTEAMMRCLETLGIRIVRKMGQIEVLGDISCVQDTDFDLDAGLSGITLRFLIALAAVVPGRKTIYGQNSRPVKELVDVLRCMGAKIDYLGHEGFPPVRVHSSSLTAGHYTIDRSVSSQYLSSLLMIAPLIGGDVTFTHIGKEISRPYIDMTIDTMAHFGVQATPTYVQGNQQYQATSYQVEGDISSASYFFAIAALTHSRITVGNVNPASKQADMQFLHILEKMGAECIKSDNAITLIGHGVHPINVNMADCPDQALTLAVLAAFAEGRTHISGIESLRIKETERIVALQTELAKMGIRTKSTQDSLTIYGGSPKLAMIDTYGDHRMAMAFAVARTALPGLSINNPEVVTKTFPDFWNTLSLVVKNIVLIGMRGAGKSSVGKLLAEKLGKEFIDMDAHFGGAIPDIVRERGWDAFRDLESQIAKEVGARKNCVIATGGGTILRKENRAALKTNGTLVLLIASTATLTARIAGDSSRPPLTDSLSLVVEMQKLWQEREMSYHQAADLVISTDAKTIAQIVDEIYFCLKKLGERSM